MTKTDCIIIGYRLFLEYPSGYWSIVYVKRYFPIDHTERIGVLRIRYPFINSYVS